MKKRHIIFFFASLAIFALMLDAVGIDSLIHGFSQIKPHYIPVLAALTFLEFYLEVCKIQVYFRRLDVHKPFWRVFYTYYLGIPVAFITPSRPIGELGRAVIFKKKLSISTNQALTATAAERIIDLVFLIAVAASGLFLFVGVGSSFPINQLLILGGIFFGLLFSSFAFLLSSRLQGIFFSILGKLENLIKLNFSSLIREYFESFRKVVVNKKILGLSLFYNTLLWGADFLRVWLLFQMFSVDVSYFAVAAITSASYLLGILSQLPGGLGAFEASSVGLYSLIAVPPEIAIPAIFIERLFSYWSYIVVGGALLVREGLKIDFERVHR
ncbi:MAG: lysylphosphatidylglycerol synthase transmembrane domain-containing protein [Candidatus Altiarchaeota archaeon]